MDGTTCPADKDSEGVPLNNWLDDSVNLYVSPEGELSNLDGKLKIVKYFRC